MIGVVRRGWSPLPGHPAAYWSSVSHEDAASAVVAALEAPAGVYNVCDDEPLTRREWADVLADAVGAPRVRLMPRWIAALGGATLELLSRSQRMTNAKLEDATVWTPRWRSAREGLRAAVRALLSQDAKPTPVRSVPESERQQGIPVASSRVRSQR
jgi:nucleoside-diphosphate-sugar epimerase